MQYTCFGAAQEVTGSCHLIEVDGRRLLLDCGLIQGTWEEEAKNAEPFPFDVGSIDVVVLSHAHIDHSGRLPLLWRAGYRGPIYTHPATRDLCSIMLRDAAYINEREAERNQRRNNKHKTEEPLYDRQDAEAVMQQFLPVQYGERTNLLPGIDIRLNDAGHILGAAIVELWLSGKEGHCKLVYSGDLGHGGRPVLQDPATIKDADTILMESTYGDRNHRGWAETYNELADIFEQATKSKGNILIPAFAVGRTQALLHLFAENRQAWGLDRWQIFLDSPMAIEATEVYFKYPNLLRKDARTLWRPGKHNDVTDRLTLTRTTEESMRLNTITGGAVIVAGSGMCTGGRIRHHLRYNVGREDCHIIIVGYQEIGTTGRALVDGAKNIRLWGDSYPVAAAIHTVGGLSAHADQTELLQWYRAFNDSPPVTLVHGEPEAQSALSKELGKAGAEVRIAIKGQTMPLPTRKQK